MSQHKEHHLREAAKNCVAFEEHSGKEGDGCPHCLSKHAMAIDQFLSEECEQGKDGAVCQLVPRARELLKKLPNAYKQGGYIDEPKMAQLQSEAREIRLQVMKALGVPEHQHRTDRAQKVEHVLVQ